MTRAAWSARDRTWKVYGVTLLGFHESIEGFMVGTEALVM